MVRSRELRAPKKVIMDIKTVVVGYDGSDCADRAVDAAVNLVNDGGVVHIVMAYDAPSNRQIKEAFAAVPPEYQASVDLLAGPRGQLENAAKYVTDKGTAAVHHLIDDDPASAILQIAAQEQADLIVVGSRGLGRAAQVVRGSVSTKIAHHSNINFLVVH